MRLVTAVMLMFFCFLATSANTQTITTEPMLTHTTNYNLRENIKFTNLSEYNFLERENNFQEPVKDDSWMDLTEENVYYLSRTIWGEARGEGKLGMLHVGSVILNRTTNPKYPRTIKAVVLQPSQFAVWRHMCRKKLKQANDASLKMAEAVAIELLRSGPINHYMYFESARLGNGGRVIGHHRFRA